MDSSQPESSLNIVNYPEWVFDAPAQAFNPGVENPVILGNSNNSQSIGGTVVTAGR